MKILGNSRGAAALLVLASAFVAPLAAAQQPPQQAQAPVKPADPTALLGSADKKFKAGDYAGALADYEASNTAKATPEAQRGIAVAHDNLGHYADAVAAYEKFLANVPAKMKDEGEAAKKRVEAIKAMPAHVRVEATPATAKVAVDGGQPTDAKELELAPGKHTLKFTAEGYDAADKEVEVTYAAKQDVRVDLTKTAAPPPVAPPVVAEPTPQPPPPPPPPEPRSKIPAFVTGGVAIVAAGVGTGFGIKALQQSNDFKDKPTTKRADDGENNALVADMMFGIAITFGVTSAVLFLSSDPAPDTNKASQAKPKKTVTITPAPYVTPHGGGVGTLVNF